MFDRWRVRDVGQEGAQHAHLRLLCAHLLVHLRHRLLHHAEGLLHRRMQPVCLRNVLESPLQQQRVGAQALHRSK
jgi:hypothetical protein